MAECNLKFKKILFPCLKSNGRMYFKIFKNFIPNFKIKWQNVI